MSNKSRGCFFSPYFNLDKEVSVSLSHAIARRGWSSVTVQCVSGETVQMYPSRRGYHCSCSILTLLVGSGSPLFRYFNCSYIYPFTLHWRPQPGRSALFSKHFKPETEMFRTLKLRKRVKLKKRENEEATETGVKRETEAETHMVDTQREDIYQR